MSSRRRFTLALLPSLILGGCSSKTPPEPLWVGHLAPLSGPGKSQGDQAQQAVRLAVEESAAVRVAGRPLAVRHADTRGEGDTGRAEAVRLIAVSKVTALIVNAEAAQAERVGRESLPYGVPVLVCGELASAPAENVFVMGAGPEPRGRVLARYAVETLSFETVAVVVDGRNALAGAFAASFVRQCRKQERPTVHESLYLNEQELKEIVSRLIKSRPAAVLLAGTARDCLRVRSDLLEAKAAVPILFGGEDLGARGLRPDSKEGPDIYLATAFAETELGEKGRDFDRRFREATGERPGISAALAYDATRLLFEAMSQAGTTSGTRIREQLAKTDDFESVTGSLSFKDRQARRLVFVVRVRGGEVKVVRSVRSDE
jgi:branched-chain amino acid transport system substrate-binding protein